MDTLPAVLDKYLKILLKIYSEPWLAIWRRIHTPKGMWFCLRSFYKITQVKGLNQKDPDKAELRDFIYEWADKKHLVPRYL